MIRVVIVDDHPVLRSGLTQLLAETDDIVVVGEAADGAEALEVVREVRPDVVLMDLQMPGTDGVSATRLIVQEQLGADVLVLTSFSDAERILAALDAGAVGYLLKDADPDEVLEGIRAVMRGESPLHPKAARQLIGGIRDGSRLACTGKIGRTADRTRGRGAGVGGTGLGEQADRPQVGHRRAHGEGAPHLSLREDRGFRSDSGRALG